jgi:hypothetical protein
MDNMVKKTVSINPIKLAHIHHGPNDILEPVATLFLLKKQI